MSAGPVVDCPRANAYGRAGAVPRMVHEVPPIEDVPHVDDVDPRTLVTLGYVRDDDTIYRVLPNHERDGQFDLVEVEDVADRVSRD